MSTLKMRSRAMITLLLGCLALVGYSDNAAAMSLFMGGEEPKPAPSSPKPVTVKPQTTPAQPGAAPAPQAGTVKPAGQPGPAGAPVSQGKPLTAGPTAGAPAQAPPVSSATATGEAKPAVTPPPAPPQAGQMAPAPAATVSKPAAPSPAPPSGPAPTQALPGTTVATATPTTEGYAYDPKSRRDPFQSLTRMLKVDKKNLEMPPLQRVQISDLKLLGIIWGGYGYYGLIQTPDGKGYTVKEGMLMGTNNGVITTITDKAIIVSEPSVDVMGNKSTKDLEILLRPKEVS